MADAAGRWQRAAILGEVHPDVAERFDLPKRAYVMELDLERLVAAVPERVPFQAIPRYPDAQRDLALVVAREVAAAEVEAVIRASGGALLRDVRLFDVYVGENIPAGRKSLAYRVTYQSPERTLTESEIEQAQASVIAALREKLGAELRG